MIYFDNAATSLTRPAAVREAVLDAMEHCGNPGRGGHGAALAASRCLFHARQTLCQFFDGEDPGRICFTSNATEALNTAIYGLFSEKDHVISTVCEHNSVLRPLFAMEKKGMSLSLLPADRQGRPALEQLESLLNPRTKAVVITGASNVTGNGTNLSYIADFCRKHGLFFVLDASQSAGCLPVSVRSAGIDVLCFTGHKGLLGPQGTGGLYVRPALTVRPLKSGGSGIDSFNPSHPSVFPTALEAGTHNTHGIAGLQAGVKYLQETGIEQIHKTEMELTRHFYEGIKDIPGITVYGDFSNDNRTAVVSLNIGDLSSGEVCDLLWADYEICVRGGAHCAPLMHKALGTAEQGTVRFSFSPFNTHEEIETAVKAVASLAEDTI